MNDIINGESLELAFYFISSLSILLIVSTLILLKIKHDSQKHERVYRKHSHARA